MQIRVKQEKIFVSVQMYMSKIFFAVELGDALPNLSGGETGIRTLGSLRYNGFQDHRFRPLSHLSVFLPNKYITSLLRLQYKVKKVHFLSLVNLHLPGLIRMFFCYDFLLQELKHCCIKN